MEQLSVLRQEMNQLSLKITSLLLKRRDLALRIFQTKKILTLNVLDPQREKELLELVSKDLSAEEKHYILEIFKEILTQTRGS
jgi:chorismate mutase